MKKDQSRYIPKKIDKKVKEASGFRCAWCGCYLTERHHIIPFYSTKSHSADGLILLCPNCHAEADSGKISISDLKKRRVDLAGKVDRSSGCLSINNEILKISVGGNYFINCRNILMFNDIPLISVVNDNGYLLISLRLFNKKGNLICWMSNNRWWVENEAILNFNHSRDKLSILSDNKTKILELRIKKDLVEISGLMHLLGSIIQLSKDEIIFRNNQNQFIGNTFNNINNAIVIREKSFNGLIPGSKGILMKI